MTQELRSELEVVGLRLGETWEALAAEQKVHEIGSSNHEIQRAIDKHGNFWEITLLSLQTTWITGIFSLLDKDTKSATLYSVLNEIRKSNTDAKFSEMEGKLEVIGNRYNKYRHKLFGHNDKKRQTFANLFDAEGFTWQQNRDDTLFLDYVFKAVWLANDGEGIPTETEARERHFPHNCWVDGVKKHTEALLNELADRQERALG
jgi:hypothetical protein